MGGISISLAFSAGLVSFLSPCVLPLIPAYMGYLSGYSNTFSPGSLHKRPVVIINGLAFILGFSGVFIFLGVAFSLIGGYVSSIREVSGKIGGLIVILFGLKLLNVIRLPFLDYEARLNIDLRLYRPLISSFMLGVIFSAGWSPCIGPVLGAILMIVVNQGNILVGMTLLSVYSLGLAVPFILISLFLEPALEWIKKLARFTKFIEIISGIILIIVGCMLILGLFEQLSFIGAFIQL